MKKLISGVLALVLALSLVPSAFAADVNRYSPAKFTDVPADAWYWDDLYYAQYNGFITGTSGTTFSPNDPVTRGQFVSILCRALGIQKSQAQSLDDDIFDDVQFATWYGPYVVYAYHQGWVSGVGDRKFAPGNTITFVQMGTLIANYLNKSGVVVVATLPPTTYKDASSIAGWAKGNMELMAKYNLLPTDAAGNVRPNQAVTRADATVAIVRLAKSLGLGKEPPALTGNEAVPAATVAEREAAVNAKVKAIHDEMWATGQITSTSTEKEKAIAYFKWMNLNCEYDVTDIWYGREFAGGSVHSAYGALIEGFGVCDGLSYAYKMLLDTEGITSKCVYTRSPGAAYGHEYVEAVLDGETLELDPASFCSAGKWPDGTVDDLMLETYIEMMFYPKDYEANNKGFD